MSSCMRGPYHALSIVYRSDLIQRQHGLFTATVDSGRIPPQLLLAAQNNMSESSRKVNRNRSDVVRASGNLRTSRLLKLLEASVLSVWTHETASIKTHEGLEQPYEQRPGYHNLTTHLVYTIIYHLEIIDGAGDLCRLQTSWSFTQCLKMRDYPC